jgi:hypothetical protein
MIVPFVIITAGKEDFPSCFDLYFRPGKNRKSACVYGRFSIFNLRVIDPPVLSIGQYSRPTVVNVGCGDDRNNQQCKNDRQNGRSFREKKLYS